MQDSFFESRGISYRTNDFRPERPTLVFLHGLSGSLSAWNAHEAALSGAYNLLLIDLRGHGLSVRPARYADYDLSEFTADVAQLIEYLKIRSCTIVAHSFGTLVAMHYLSKPEHRASAVVLLSPNYMIHSTLTAKLCLLFVMLGSHIGGLFPFHPKKGGRFDYSRLQSSPDWDLQRIVPEISSMGLRPYLYCLEHIYRFKGDELWAKISVPTLIIHGKKDRFVPFNRSLMLAKAIPQAELHIWDHACHMLVLNDQKALDGEISAFAPR